MRRRLGGLLALLLFAGGLAWLGLLALSAGWQRERVRALAEDALARATGATVELGALEGPLYPELVLRDLRIASPRGWILSSASLRARVALGPLLGGRLVLSSLTVASPTVTVERAETLLGEGPGGRGAPALPIRLERVALLDGRLDIAWEQRGRPSRLRGGFGMDALGVGLARNGAIVWPRNASLDASLEPSQVEGRALRSGLVALRLLGSRLRVERSAFEGDFGRARLRGSTDLARWLKGEGGAPLEVEATAEGVELAVLTGLAELEGRALRSLELRARYGPEGWQVDQAELESDLGSGSLRGRGTADRMERLELALREVDLGILSRLLPAQGALRGRARVEGDLAGAFAAPRGQLLLEVAALGVGERELGDLRVRLSSAGDRRIEASALELRHPRLHFQNEGPARFSLDEEGLTVERLVLVADRQRLELAGRLEGGRLRGGRVDARELALEPIAAVLGLREELGGHLSASLSIEGDPPFFDLSGDGSWRGARFRGFRAQRVDARVETREGWLRGSAQVDDPARGGLRVEAALPLERGRIAPLAALRAPEARLRLRGSSFDLARLRPLLGGDVRELAGRADLDLQLAGDPAFPTLDGTLALRGGALALVGDTSVWRPVEARAAFQGRRADVVALRLGTPAGEVRFAGSLAAAPLAEGGIELSGDARSFQSPWLAARTGAPARAVLKAGGTLDVSSLELVSGGGTLALRGRLQGTRLSGVWIALRNFDVADLSRRLRLDPPLAGRLSGELRAEGRLPLPRLDGALDWREPAVGVARADRLHVDLAGERKRLRADATLFRDGKQALVARAWLPRDAERSDVASLLSQRATRLEVRGEAIEVAWLAPLLPPWLRRPTGRLSVDARAEGAPGSPALSGEIRLADGGVDLPALRQRLAPIEGELRLEGDTLRVAHLRAGSEGADARLRGSVPLRSRRLRPADLELRLNGLPVGGGRALRARARGAVHLDGSLEAPRIRGRIRLEEARLELPEPEDPLLREIRVIALDEAPLARVEGARRPALWKGAELDLRLVVPRDSWVHARGSTLEVQGEVALAKDAGAPLRYAGALSAVRGTWRLHGKLFRVERAVATFPGGSEPDPHLDVIATHRVRDVKLIAALTGFLSSPRLDLSSDPPLDESDRLAYLAFGRPARELGAARASDVEAAAAALASQMALDRASAVLGRHLPVDTVTVATEGEGTEPKLEVGRYVRDDVFVRVGQGMGRDRDSSVAVEWRFAPEWSVESEVSREREAAGGVIWSRDY